MKKSFFSTLPFSKKNKESILKTTAYYEAMLELFLDAYIVINKENNEIVDFNDKAVSMFELPPELDLKNIQLIQLMMRYLAEDSINKDLMMNGIPDHWNGEAGFINHHKEKFYAYIKSNIYYYYDTIYMVLTIRKITENKTA